MNATGCAHQAGCAGAGEALRAGMAAWVDEEAAGAVVAEVVNG